MYNNFFKTIFSTKHRIVQCSSVLVGVLLDVSGSMKANFQNNDEGSSKQPNSQQITRAESIFKTVITIAEKQVNESRDRRQDIFVLAFGLNDQPTTCDLLGLLEKLKPLKSDEIGQNSYGSRQLGTDKLVELFEQKGRRNLRRYIEEYLTQEEATFMYNYYSKNDQDFREIIKELPSDSDITVAQKSENVEKATDEKIKSLQELFKLSENARKYTNPVAGRPLANKIHQKVENVIEKAFQQIRSKMLKELESIKMPKSKTFKLAVDLLHKVGGESSGESGESSSFSPEQFRNLIFYVKLFIYGFTPLCEALQSALDLFSQSDHDTKILFILTDGEATDGNPAQYAERFREQNIHVFVSLITTDNIDEPRKLYYKPDSEWNTYAKNMFELSSFVANTHTAMSVLLERGWKLPASGESGLFVQINHSDVLDEFCSLVRDMCLDNEALLSIFGRVSLDQYINSEMTDFCVPKQDGNTCYANAVAAVLHLAMSRIVGRVVPEFEALRSEIIAAFGKDGAETRAVLREWSKKCRLQYAKVDEEGAKQAINARRPVVTTFRLTQKQWDAFKDFYKRNPQGILEEKDLQTNCSPKEETIGHAVVLMKNDSQGLTFMNSWGSNFGNDGLFKVRDQSVLNATFYDVFWTLDKDISQAEKDAYEERKNSVAREVAQNHIPQHLKKLPYKCPICSKSSPAIDFAGHLREAKCPKCKQNFIPTPLGFVLNW